MTREQIKILENARMMIFDRLRQLGADGLCCHGCGCGFEDMYLCESDKLLECVPAKLRMVTHKDCEECGSNDNCDHPADEGDEIECYKELTGV